MFTAFRDIAGNTKNKVVCAEKKNGFYTFRKQMADPQHQQVQIYLISHFLKP